MDKIVIPERWNSLDKVWQGSWAMLAGAVADPGSPLRTPVLGTSGEDGPNLRTVVLRQVVAAEHLLRCNTDRRSQKVREIEAHSRVSWLFYDPGEKVQFRLAGPAALHREGPLVEESWASLNERSRPDYLAVEPPGSPLVSPGSGLPEGMAARTLAPAQQEAARRNFIVVVCRVDRLDWLRLGEEGHLRAQFRWEEGRLVGTWVVP